MSLADCVEYLLKMAEELKARGERDLAAECKATATRILDYIAWVEGSAQTPYAEKGGAE